MLLPESGIFTNRIYRIVASVTAHRPLNMLLRKVDTSTSATVEELTNTKKSNE